MTDKPRNAQAQAAWRRKAGAHSGARRPDVFDRINDYEEEEMEELKVRAMGFPNVGDRVRVVDGSRYNFEEGRITLRKDGMYGVVFDWDTAGIHHFVAPHHLEIVNDR